jgi:hypothetical protein
MTWVVVFSLPSTSHITLGNSIFILVIGGLAMSAPVQSGLGAFHYIVSRGLLIVNGIPVEDGLAYAICCNSRSNIFLYYFQESPPFGGWGVKNYGKNQNNLRLPELRCRIS